MTYIWCDKKITVGDFIELRDLTDDSHYRIKRIIDLPFFKRIQLENGRWIKQQDVYDLKLRPLKDSEFKENRTNTSDLLL